MRKRDVDTVEFCGLQGLAEGEANDGLIALTQHTGRRPDRFSNECVLNDHHDIVDVGQEIG